MLTRLRLMGEHESWAKTHVGTHSHYHRGQIASGMRQAGGPPASTDFIVFAGTGISRQ
jgi:uncharacterized damage-inducible protein DinB